MSGKDIVVWIALVVLSVVTARCWYIVDRNNWSHFICYQAHDISIGGAA